MQCLVSISDGLAGYTFPLYNTLAVQKALAHSIEPVRALGLLTLLHDPKPSGSSQSELATNCARENVDEEAMISRDSDEGDLEDDEGAWIYWKGIFAMKTSLLLLDFPSIRKTQHCLMGLKRF